jgi:hypothetical protein
MEYVLSILIKFIIEVRGSLVNTENRKEIKGNTNKLRRGINKRRKSRRRKYM